VIPQSSGDAGPGFAGRPRGLASEHGPWPAAQGNTPETWMSERSTNNDAAADSSEVTVSAAGARWLDRALVSTHAQLDEVVRAWVADLASVRDSLRASVGSPADASDAGLRLERLEAALRAAPGRIVEHLRQRTVAFASLNATQLRTIGDHQATEKLLNAANTKLRLNITERERLERATKLSERSMREVRERFESAFNNAPIGMALISLDGHLLQVNDALCRITGHTSESLKATTLAAITHPEDVGLDGVSRLQLLMGEVASYQVENRLRHAWGHDVWVLATTSVVRDEDDKPLHIVTQVQDISERRELARRLEYVVDHDFLTGLLSRRHFEQELARETERSKRYGTPGAVMLIDLDNFKDVNDTFGHRAGDDVLKGVASLLRQRLRQTDVVARVGGDEFAVLLTQTNAEQVLVVADEVVRALGRQTAVLADQRIHLTASIGIAMFDGRSDVEVLANADLAMYEAKETGRNRYEVYRPLMGGRERVSARLAEAEWIRKSLEDDALILYCQPILDLAGNEVCQHELLLRLPDEERGEPLPPSAFLYRAERSGLIQGIDSWVVKQAIGLIADHAAMGHRLLLNVNLSGRSIGDRKLAALIEADLTESGIDPSQLTFELTETAAIANIEEAKTFALRMHARGCRFALDDFGSGFGSFYYLKSFPFDFLKIDGDFVRGLTTSPINQLVVGAIVSIAQGLGIKTVAEFVADEDTAELLRSLGVDHAQGYHIGMPRPISEVL
jgi:diguanylate cyclase (GGDEF)-like protein/PAS domain S-box-containing protein